MNLPKELTKVTPLSKYLAIILFFLLPFIGFFLGLRYQEMMDLTKSQQEENSFSTIRIPTPTPDETANWKTYTYEKNSFNIFSIQYPEKLTVKEDTDSIIFTNSRDPSEFPNLLIIRIFDGSAIQTNEPREYYEPQSKEWKSVMIGHSQGSYMEATGGTLNGFAAVLNQPGKVFLFQLANRENQEYISNKEFFQILSTFKFTN